jgi:hypothetical protein
MELLFVLVISAGLGLGVRFASGNGRTSYGITLVPAISVAVTGIVWVALLWLGFTFDGGWIWLISLVVGPVVALIVALRLPRARANADRAMLTRLSGGKA